jgi:hypothetical protein
MTLRHNNVEYEFDYDFAPNDGTMTSVVTVVDGQELGGEIVIKDVTVNGRPQPITVETLAEIRPLMQDAAAREELEQNRLAWQRLHSAAESRRGRISVVPRRG